MSIKGAICTVRQPWRLWQRSGNRLEASTRFPSQHGTARACTRQPVVAGNCSVNQQAINMAQLAAQQKTNGNLEMPAGELFALGELELIER